jgi:hypothetical protein
MNAFALSIPVPVRNNPADQSGWRTSETDENLRSFVLLRFL